MQKHFQEHAHAKIKRSQWWSTLFSFLYVIISSALRWTGFLSRVWPCWVSLLMPQNKKTEQIVPGMAKPFCFERLDRAMLTSPSSRHYWLCPAGALQNKFKVRISNHNMRNKWEVLVFAPSSQRQELVKIILSMVCHTIQPLLHDNSD